MLSSFTPSISERRAIGLLLLTGEKYDQYKYLLNDRRTESKNVFQVFNILQDFVSRSQFVKPDQLPLVINVAIAFASQLDKLGKSLGVRRLALADSIRGANDYGKLSWRFFHIEDPSILHLYFCDRNAALSYRRGTLQALALPKVLDLFSEPKLREVQHDIGIRNERRSKEDPCHSARLRLIPSRKRCFSMVELAEPLAKTARVEDIEEALNVQYEDVDGIMEPSLYEEKNVSSFLNYCRRKDVCMNERWLCSSTLPFLDSHVHPECYSDVRNERIGEEYADYVSRNDKVRKFGREFVVLM